MTTQSTSPSGKLVAQAQGKNTPPPDDDNPEGATTAKPAATKPVTKKKAVTKKKVATKKKAAAKTKDENIDLLASIAMEVENYAEDDAVDKMTDLMQDVYTNYFKIGGVLSVIQANSWWKAYGFDSFKSFVIEHFGGSYRTAMYWLRIYNDLIEADIPWDAVKNVGWTKLKELSAILTKDNLEFWVKKAEELTAIQLIKFIADYKQKENKANTTDDDMEDAKGKLTTYTCKVHEDQKEMIKEAIIKAKSDANTEFDGVALESICMNYLNVEVPKGGGGDLQSIMAGMKYNEVLAAFEVVFPDVNLVVKE